MPEARSPTWLPLVVFALGSDSRVWTRFAKLRHSPAVVLKGVVMFQRLWSWTWHVDELITARHLCGSSPFRTPFATSDLKTWSSSCHRRKSTWLLLEQAPLPAQSDSDLRIFMASLYLRICGSIRCVRIFCAAVAMRHNNVTLPGVCLQPRLIVLVFWRADGAQTVNDNRLVICSSLQPLKCDFSLGFFLS